MLLAIGALAPAAVWIALSTDWPWVAAPFGWWHVALVTSLLVWPACYFAGWRIAAGVNDASRQTASRAAVGLAVAVAIGTLLAVNPLALWLEDAADGFAARSVARVAPCVLLELPWHVAAWLAVPAAARAQQAPRGLVVLAIVVAAVLPAAYVRDYAARQTEALKNDLARNQILSAGSISAALVEVGSPWLIDEQPARTWRDRTADRVAQLLERVQSPLGPDASNAERLQRAQDLAMLQFWPQAREVIGPLARQYVDAAMLMAVIWQDQRDFVESDRYYQRALDLLGDDRGESSLTHRRRAIDGLAYNAREDRRPLDAEKIYRSAIADLPDSEAAYFHFQLGRHYELGGRPRDALGELQTAERLNPAQFAGPVAALIDSMRVSSPACVLAPPVVLEESQLPGSY